MALTTQQLHDIKTQLEDSQSYVHKLHTVMAREAIKKTAKIIPNPFPNWCFHQAKMEGHKQPAHYLVLIYATHALMTSLTMNEELSVYDDLLDTPVNQPFQGLMWKSERDSKWFLNWLDYPLGSEELERYSVPIMTVEMLHLLNPPTENENASQKQRNPRNWL